MKHQRPLIVITLIILAFFCAVIPARTARAASGVPKVDAVLVLDASNSMRTSDPNKISVEAMNMFIDMLGVSGDKVGVVSYTSEIEREKAMTSIRGMADKILLKDFISQLNYGSFTDISLGLSQALTLMDDAHDDAHLPIIILLTDGTNELDPGQSKTLADADADTARVIADAQSKGYRIYTIGLNYDGYLNRPYLENIAGQTDALFFETKEAAELPGILSAIFADQMELKIANMDPVTADGTFQTLDIDIPGPHILEANVTFLSGSPVAVELYDPQGNPVLFDPNGEAVLTQSRAYSLLKIIAPRQGNWQLRFKGVSGDQIRISLLYQYGIDLNFTVHAPANVYEGDSVPVRVELLEGGAPSVDEALYTESTCRLRLYDADTHQESVFNAVYQNGAFEADVLLPEAHTYELTARVEHPNFFRDSAARAITVLAGGAPAVTAAPTVIPSGTPVPTAAPSASPLPSVPGPPAGETDNTVPWYFFLIGGSALLLIIAACVLVFIKMKNNARVFTGKLVIEITNNYTRERSAPQYRNLIEYGKKTDLLTLLNHKESPLLAHVNIAPSPGAPSHMPRLLVKCANPQIKFKKDFMEQDAAQGIEMNLKSELAVLLEAENKQIKMRYTE